MKQMRGLKRVLFSGFIFVLLLCPFSSVSASTISVKLMNELGDKTSVNFVTQGTYHVGVRYTGQDRFQVASNIASDGWDHADTVFIVNYSALADALSAAPLAKKNDGPILLTQPNVLSDETRLSIQTLHPSKILIIGGTGSVSANVENQLRTLTSNIERIGGSDRFEVSKAIAEKMGYSTSAIVTNGLIFSDALAIAPYAAQSQIPILLTYNDRLPESTKLALQGKTSTLVIGGTGSVTNSVENQLPNPNRIGGADRYEVSANIIKQLNLNADTVFLSNGLTFADALTGSVLAAKKDAPLLLVKSDSLPSPITDIIREKGSSIINVLGGPASVSDTVVNNLPNNSTISQGITYTVKAELGKLTLYKGATKIKDFDAQSFTLGTTYSVQNKAEIFANSTVSHPYLGNIEFVLENGFVRPINKNIAIEDYVKGALINEITDPCSVDSEEAMAIVSRTLVSQYAGDTIDDTRNYQLYSGYVDRSTPSSCYPGRIVDAVEGTTGLVLRYNGELITPFFNRSNGGKILSYTNVYGPVHPEYPYFTTKDDPYDSRSGGWAFGLNKKQIALNGYDLTRPDDWWNSITENDLIFKTIKTELVNQHYIDPRYEIKVIEVPEISFSSDFTNNDTMMGHLKFIYLLKDTTNGSYVMDENGSIKFNELSIDRSAKDICSLFGQFASSSYVTQIINEPLYWIVNGSGSGNGIGMSLTGAGTMGNTAINYRTILQFYYPGTTVSK